MRSLAVAVQAKNQMIRLKNSPRAIDTITEMQKMAQRNCVVT